MREKLQELVRLQEIDKSIASLLKEKEVLPAELQRFEEELKNEESTIKAEEETKFNLIKERRQKEREAEEKNTQRKKLQGQLYQVKTNKEYAALMQELNNLKLEIDKTEEETLILMEKIDEVERALTCEQKELDKRRKEWEAVWKSNAEKEAKLTEKLNDWEKTRSKKTSSISVELLHEYERIRRGRNGMALAAVKNNACQGCFMELPPQVISEMRLGQRLIFCENCNRLLYLE